MGWDPAVVPDPQDPATFERSKLDWSEASTGRHAMLLEVYRELARLRRAHPDLTDPSFGSVSCTADEESRVFTMRRGGMMVVVNFGDQEATVAVDGGRLLFATPSGATLADGRLELPPHAGAVVG